jgi:hypothetical protein
VYAREVDGKTLTLGVSGMLWNRSLVMYDKETNSLWSHILGKAMQGKLRGKELVQVPSVMTDWKTWSKDHPDGTVAMLSRTAREYRREFYRRPADFVLGIAEAGKAMAWGFDALSKTPVVNDSWDRKPVVVFFDKESMTARLFSRRVKGRELTFEVSGAKIKDKQTDSTWEPTTGRAVDGPLKGSHLEALPAIVSYRKTWLAFHPDPKE